MITSPVIGQDCPASTARCAYRIPCLEPAIVLDAVSEAECLASPANETTAVEVSYKVEQVADGCFDEREKVCFHGNISVCWTRKETAVQQGCHTAVEKTGVGDPHLV
jgi:hypothetical protein